MIACRVGRHKMHLTICFPFPLSQWPSSKLLAQKLTDRILDKRGKVSDPLAEEKKKQTKKFDLFMVTIFTIKQRRELP